MAFTSISSNSKQYMFACFDYESPWWFSFKRFILTENDPMNGGNENIKGQFISSGWFSQSISENHLKDYLFMVIEFTGDFSYVDFNGGLYPSLVIELNNIVSQCQNPNLNQVVHFIVNNCARVSNAFLFDFGRNTYKDAMDNSLIDDNIIPMECSENDTTITLYMNCRKYKNNGVDAFYISNPEFNLIR